MFSYYRIPFIHISIVDSSTPLKAISGVRLCILPPYLYLVVRPQPTAKKRLRIRVSLNVKMFPPVTLILNITVMFFCTFFTYAVAE